MTRQEPDSQGGETARRVAGRRELWLRAASASVLAPVAVAVAYVGGWPFLAFWGAASIGVWWEWTALTAGPSRGAPFAMGSAALGAAIVLFGDGRSAAAVTLLAVGMVVTSVLAPGGRRGWTVAGGASASAVLVAPTLLRTDAEWGFCAVILLFAVVWTTDVAAYFVGRMVGGPKLLPVVSPNKTWSGAVGGILAAVTVGLIAGLVGGLGNVPALVMLCGGLSVVAEVGDLLESAVKRRFGAKDASHLIPGHGGLMDRLDGFTAAAVAGTLIGLLRGGVDAPARGLLIW